MRAIFGAVLIILLTLLVRSYDYNGAGMDVIERAMERDNFMTPQEAKKFGLIDHIVTSREELSK